MRETHFRGLGFKHLECRRLDVTLDCEVMARRCKVLTEGEHVDIVGAQVAHDVEDFFIALAQAQHQARLGRHLGMQGLEVFQQFERVVIVGAGARFFVEARHRFEIVVHHVGRRSDENFQRAVEAAAKIRRENFNARGR